MKRVGRRKGSDEDELMGNGGEMGVWKGGARLVAPPHAKMHEIRVASTWEIRVDEE